MVSAHTVAGEASAMLHVMAEDTRDLELTLERIRKVDGVDRTVTEVVLDAVRAVRRPFPDGQPPSIRDFFAFEQHVRSARGDVPDAWYRIPVFYFSNPAAVYRDGDGVPRPADAHARLQLRAAVIGEDGGIEGFTIMNDWSARDLQGRRWRWAWPREGQGLRHLARPRAGVAGRAARRPRPAAGARVNGEVRSDSRTGAMNWSWDQLVDAAARQHPWPPGRRRARLRNGAAAASSSTATAARLRPAMRVELEMEASASCATPWASPRPQAAQAENDPVPR